MATTRTSTLSADPRRTPAPQELDRRTLFRGIGAAGLLTATGILAVPLRASAADDTVKTTQTGLHGLDYYSGAIDGETGPKTAAATKAFQKDRLLSVDGEPGPQTVAELESVIGAVQGALDIEASGTFDDATTEAVTAFQTSQDGLEPTGRAGEKTMTALDVERVREPVGGEPNAEISREDVIERAMFWVDDPRPYSMKKASPGIDGKQWRTDCSGFVSMAWNLRRSDGDTGTGTGQLPEVLERIEKDDLKPGDALLITPGANGQSYGHVVLFNGWTDDAQTEYEGLEQVGGSLDETTKRAISYPYDSGNGESYEPYRYPKIID